MDKEKKTLAELVLISDIWALRRSGLSAEMSEIQSRLAPLDDKW